MNKVIPLLVASSAFSLLVGCGGEKVTTADSAPETKAASTDAGPVDAPEAEAAGDPASITGADLAKHIAILASDEYEGRAPGTAGGDKTRTYIADEYKRIGLEPVNGSYFQTVPMVETTLDPVVSSFAINGEALEYKVDTVYWTKRVEEEVSFADTDMVFVGYGIVAPEYGWNDYDGIDVEGKTVVMLVNDPGFATQDPELFNGNAMTYYGRWTYKYEEAARQGAAGALVIHDTVPAAYGWGVVEGGWSGPQLDLERADGGANRAALEGWLSNDAARQLLTTAGLDLDELMAASKVNGFEPVAIEGARASATLVSKIQRSEGANVLGILPGTEAPDEYVLYMAHWDHLGINPTQAGDDKIFNGAVDNATGVAAIIEIAEAFANADVKPRRSILLAAVTAEESGLLGSAYMAEEPPVPFKSIVGGINIDAILPTPPTNDMIVVGYGASELEDLLKIEATISGRTLSPDAEPEKGYFYRSDHISFAKKGVPMLYADSGQDFREGGMSAGKAFGADYVQSRYHKPADEFNGEWRFDGMTETVDILYRTGATMANSNQWPNWYEGNEFRALRDAQMAEE